MEPDDPLVELAGNYLTAFRLAVQALQAHASDTTITERSDAVVTISCDLEAELLERLGKRNDPDRAELVREAFTMVRAKFPEPWMGALIDRLIANLAKPLFRPLPRPKP